MSKKDFEEMLNKHKKNSEENKINWDEKKNEWLNFVKTFYESIEKWVKPYQDDKKLSFNYEKISLTEEYIGTYYVDCMTINFAGQRVKLTPIGTNLIGTKGRIDMEGARGIVRFILADKNSKGIGFSISVSINGEQQPEQSNKTKIIEWTWKIALKDSRKMLLEDFNEENFFDVLLEVING